MERFPNNSRVCFIGDSITHANLYLAHIVSYYKEYFPESGVEFYNCGISGGTLNTTLSAFEEDIAPYNPTHAVLFIGINDSSRDYLLLAPPKKLTLLKEAYLKYEQNLNKLCEKLRAIDCELILCTPTPYAEFMESNISPLPDGYELIQRYAQFLINYSKKNGYPLCDYHTYFSKLIKSEEIYHPDRVHPNERGHYYIAKCFLDFQGITLCEEKPLREDIKKWHSVVTDIRDTIATEHFILRDDFTTTDEERAEAIKAYLQKQDNGPHAAYFKMLSQKYPSVKAKQKENIQFVINFMKNK